MKKSIHVTLEMRRRGERSILKLSLGTEQLMELDFPDSPAATEVQLLKAALLNRPAVIQGTNRATYLVMGDLEEMVKKDGKPPNPKAT